jgi:DMSO reductase anchor subunit
LNTIHLVQAIRQKVWGWPVVVNFLLGGMASGLYLLGYFLRDDFVLNMGSAQRTTFSLLPAIFICLGFLTVGIESGRPSRGKYLLLHSQRSWMSREVLFGGIFVAFSVFNCFFSHLIFKFVASLAAIGFVLAQGMMVFRACGIAAWNRPIVPLHFIFSSFALGFGLLLMWMTVVHAYPNLNLILIGLCCLILNVCIWVLYLFPKRNWAFYQATWRLRETLSLTLSVGCGILIPGIILLIMVFCVMLRFPSDFLNLLCFLAGATILCGGVSQKFQVILEANYLRAILAGPNHGLTREKE